MKPQDILFILKLVSLGEKQWVFNKLAVDLGMSASEVHAASKRALNARLVVKLTDSIRPNQRNVKEFLWHGIQYVFVPEKSGVVRGMPTAHAAEPLVSLFASSDDLPPVWPDPEGSMRGESFSPLYPSVPRAAKNDRKLYQLLALVDALRGGRARERELAKGLMSNMLSQS